MNNTLNQVKIKNWLLHFFLINLIVIYALAFNDQRLNPYPIASWIIINYGLFCIRSIAFINSQREMLIYESGF